jgi:hypothetical protein
LIIKQKGAQAVRELQVVGYSFFFPKALLMAAVKKFGKFKKLTLLSFNLTTDLQ